MKPICLALLMVGLFSPWSAYGQSEQPPSLPPLMEVLQVQEPIDFCGEKVPLEDQEIRERFEKELLLSMWDRAQVLLWLKRSRRYLPLIEDMLKSQGLPADLKYVAVAESALLEHIHSSKGAAGMWQFMSGTGEKYGLTIDRHLDERRDPIASTRAAIRYFQELFSLFNSWTLSAAAYNMGEDRLAAEIQDQGTADYYKLYLPQETQRFLFRILSVKRILSNPASFGFQLTDGDFYPPIAFEEVKITLTQELPLRVIANAAGTHYKKIRDLNPALKTRYLPKGNHALRLPEGASSSFHKRLDAAAKSYLSIKTREFYVIQAGDSLSAVAARFGVPLSSILLWNRMDPGKPIHPGQRLWIYPKSTGTVLVEDGAEAD